VQPQGTCLCRSRWTPNLVRGALRQALGMSARSRASSVLPATWARCASGTPQTSTTPHMQGAVTLQPRQCDHWRCCGAVWLHTVLPNSAFSGCYTAQMRVSVLVVCALVGPVCRVTCAPIRL